MVPELKRRGIPSAVDPKEEHFLSYRGVDVITPNLSEASQAWGRRIRTAEELLEAGFGLREKLSAGAVLITRGEEGMSLFTEVTGLSGVVPGIVTVTSCMSVWSLGPRTDNTYVVVCRGVTCLVPRASTAPIPGSIETPIGFSISQSSRTACPAFEVAGCAVNRTTRARSCGVPV